MNPINFSIMSVEIKSTTVVKRKENDLLISPLADEIVMMNVKSGDYLGLNKVASDIWNKIETSCSVSEICDELLLKYEIDEQSCKDQTFKLVQKLVDNQLVEIQSE